jgi:phosphoribosylanthranilate isomerase
MTNSQVKICGITTITDANFAISFGADYLGFIFYPKSKRYISYDNCKEIIDVIKDKIKTVAVTVDPSDNDILEINKLGVDYIQLHGSETVERVTEIKTKCTSQ